MILDPSIMERPELPSSNTGDLIIARAVLREVQSALPGASISRYSTHVRLNEAELFEVEQSDWTIVGGSNLLGNPRFSRRRLRYWKQWDITGRDASRIQRAVLLGVGWQEYDQRASRGARRLYSRALAGPGDDLIHSVRDPYTREKLASFGLKNVVNTGCPTLWPLADNSASHISSERSDFVLTTVTDYRRDIPSDIQLQELLLDSYDRVFLWPQGANDLEYLRELGTHARYPNRIQVLGSSLTDLDEFLDEVDCDYVGTRLHCGIHCLNAGKRSLILAVDNRAKEMAPPLALPIRERDDIAGISAWISNPVKTFLRIDREAIDVWKDQFNYD